MHCLPGALDLLRRRLLCAEEADESGSSRLMSLRTASVVLPGAPDNPLKPRSKTLTERRSHCEPFGVHTARAPSPVKDRDDPIMPLLGEAVSTLEGLSRRSMLRSVFCSTEGSIRCCATDKSAGNIFRR